MLLRAIEPLQEDESGDDRSISVEQRRRQLNQLLCSLLFLCASLGNASKLMFLHRRLARAMYENGIKFVCGAMNKAFLTEGNM